MPRPRIPKESPVFDADNRWTRTWIMYFESLFDLAVQEAVRLAGTVTHTGGDLTKDLPVFGNDKADVKVGTKSGNTNEVATVSGAVVTGNTVEWDADGNLIDAGVTPGGGGGGGVTAVTGTAPIASSGGTTPAISIAAFTGDSGSGGAKGAVPAPAAGDAAAAKVLGAGGGWVAGAAGTVTSVALTVPAEFSVSGSPVTTSGTLAVSKATQSANAVFAGPTTGSAAAPTFRAVVPADLPLASSSAFGAVKVDGTTITAASGVISAAGGASGALVLLESHTASSSASLNFTTRNAPGQSGATFQSDYDQYVIRFVNVLPASGANNLWMRVSTNGGSSYDTGSNYSYNNSYTYATGSGANGVVSAGDTKVIVAGTQVGNSTAGVCGTVELNDPVNASLHKLGICQIIYYHDSLSTDLRLTAGFRYKSTTAVNALQFLFGSGNIASGIIRVYGVAK